ncbi:MAG: CHAT domain-containing protein [Negativicutes bacterium]|nr:CHAT domain-containing protein [Negativicutes bacterium]
MRKGIVVIALVVLLFRLFAGHSVYAASESNIEALEEKVQQELQVKGEKSADTWAAMNELAIAYNKVGNYKGAALLFEKTLKLRTEMLGERHPDTIASMGYLAHTYRALGRYGDALVLDQKALALRTEILGERHQDTIRSMAGLANTYRALARYAEALPFDEKVLKLRTEMLGERHPDTIAGMGFLAYTYRALGRYGESLMLDEKALELRTEMLGEKHPDTIRSMANIANTYRALARYAEALPFDEKVLKIRTEILGERHPDTITSMAKLANTYRGIGRFGDALALSEKVLKLRTEILGERHPDTITSMDYLATAHRALGRRGGAWELGDTREFNEALALYEKALKLRAEILGERHPDTIASMANMATNYRFLGRYAESLAFDEKALQLRTEILGERHPDTIMTMDDLANTYRALRRYGEALALEQKVLQLRIEIFGPSDLHTINSMRDIATIYNDLGRHSEAIRFLQKAVNGIEHLRADGGLSPENRQAFLAIYIPNYERLSRWYVRSAESEKAFDIAELSKARTLLESATARLADQSGILSDEECQQLKEYSQRKDGLAEAIAEVDARLADLAGKITRATGQPELLSSLQLERDNLVSGRINLETEKNEMLKQYNTYLESLTDKYPKYAMLSKPHMVSAAEGEKLIPAGAVLISYLQSDKHILAFVIDPQMGLTAVDLGDIPKLDVTIGLYREMLSTTSIRNLKMTGKCLWLTPDGSYQLTQGSSYLIAPTKDAQAVDDTGLDKYLNQTAAYLGDKLLAPLAKYIGGKDRWIISPDGALAFLPFETLNYEGKPVIAAATPRHDISYIQSLSMYVLLKQREQTNQTISDRKYLFAMGAAHYGRDTLQRGAEQPDNVDLNEMISRSSDPDIVERSYNLLNLRFGDLPTSEKEVDIIAALFPGSSAVYKKDDATEAKLIEVNKTKELSQYKYILFSTHGFFSPEVPALSAIVLGQQNKVAGTNGFITVSKWPRYDLNSDLVFMSACETGRGKVIRGEGVMGLPFALYVAGNKNTVMTLWSVCDDSTTDFSTSFFRKIQSGMDQVTALNQTKREFINNGKYSRPVYWAPFMLYGI